jgi:hypothetical protein
VVVDGRLHARNGGQGGRHEGLLQYGQCFSEPGPVGVGLPTGLLGLRPCSFGLGAGLLGLLAAAQELFLVGPPVRGVEDGGADELPSPRLSCLIWEETSTGSLLPSAVFSSRAMPPSSPRIRSRGAKCVSWYSFPPTVSRSTKRLRPTTASRARPSQVSRVLLILVMVPSIRVER